MTLHAQHAKTMQSAAGQPAAVQQSMLRPKLSITTALDPNTWHCADLRVVCAAELYTTNAGEIPGISLAALSWRQPLRR